MDEPIEVQDIGSFFVGGRDVVIKGQPKVIYELEPGSSYEWNPNGDYVAGHMYVQYVKLKRPKARYPLVLIHGGFSTGRQWETTADGRPGWQMFFLRAGHDVYVPDQVARGRSGFSSELLKSPVICASKQFHWEASRIGPAGSYAAQPADRSPYPDTRYVVEKFDDDFRQKVPTFTATVEEAATGYHELVERIGPCTIVASSRGGVYAFKLAYSNPAKVAAIVSLEAGSPDPSRDVQKIAHIPQLFMTAEHYPAASARQLEKSVANLNKHGGKATWYDLPRLGLRGNSHNMVSDNNSDELAGLVQRWFTEQGLTRE